MNEILSFRSPSDFRKWLSANHRQSDGIWLRIFKKDSGEPTVTYAEALDEALCHGWIDGQKQSHDDLSWRQRFTPRRPKSGWSKINTRHAERLIKAGRMKAAGQAQIDAAKKDGRWTAAYDSFSKATFPEDFLGGSPQEQKSEHILRVAQQGEPLRNCLPPPNREEARNQAAPHGNDSCNAEPRRSIPLVDGTRQVQRLLLPNKNQTQSMVILKARAFSSGPKDLARTLSRSPVLWSGPSQSRRPAPAAFSA